MGSEIISIIIPVFNAEKYLCDCLNSVINQSYTKLEIILVNDGSTDKSLVICNNYKKTDNRIKIINKDNEGLSKARQIGIKNCTGKYFATIDSDDVLDIKYVELMYKEITRYDADICLCGRISFEGDKIIQYPLNRKLVECAKMEKHILEQKYALYAELYQMSDSWNKLYRTSFVKTSGVTFILDKKYNGTDMLFNHMLLLHEPVIATIKKNLYHYRIVSNSIVRRKNKPLQDGFEFIITRLLEETKKCNYTERIRNQLYISYIGMIKYVTLDIELESEKQEKIIRFKNCMDKYKKFVSKNGFQLNFSQFINMRLKIFWIIMQTGNVNLLEKYYWLRRVIR